MTKKEFTERTGINPTDEQYKQIEIMYLNAGDNIDKDVFCKDYKRHSDSVLLQDYTKQNLELKEQLSALKRERERMVEFLVEQAHKWSATDLRTKAISMVGEKEYIRIKLLKEQNLWDMDKEMLINLLSK